MSILEKAVCSGCASLLQSQSLSCENVIFFTKSNIKVRASMVCSFCLPIPYTKPLVYKNLLIPLILTHHTFRLTRTFSQSDVLMHLIWLVESFVCQYWFLFLWRIPGLPSFLHFDFWFIICFLFFNSFIFCFSFSWGVLF